MARPTKRTPTVKERVLEATRLGATRARAAAAAGIAESLLYDMMAKDVEFLEAVQKAEGERADEALAAIRKAAPDSWQAAAWYLERRYPAEYGRTVQEHTG